MPDRRTGSRRQRATHRRARSAAPARYRRWVLQANDAAPGWSQDFPQPSADADDRVSKAFFQRGQARQYWRSMRGKTVNSIAKITEPTNIGPNRSAVILIKSR